MRLAHRTVGPLLRRLQSQRVHLFQAQGQALKQLRLQLHSPNQQVHQCGPCRINNLRSNHPEYDQLRLLIQPCHPKFTRVRLHMRRQLHTIAQAHLSLRLDRTTNPWYSNSPRL